MAQGTPVTGKTTITANGSYSGTADNNEKVLFGTHAMTALLYDIDRVVGSSGNDLVYFSRTDPERHASINLGAGDDLLFLAGGQEHVMKIRGVETVSAEPGASLSIMGSASFSTDGSFDISRASGAGRLDISFFDIAADITLAPGSGRHVFEFDPDFDFKVDGEGRLVVAQNGNELAFEGVDPGNVAITIVVGDDSYTYAEMVLLASSNAGPEVVSITNDHPDGVVSDDDRVVTYTVAFSDPVVDVTPEDLFVQGGVLASGPLLAADGLSLTFAVEASLESKGQLLVVLGEGILGLDGSPLEPAYDESVAVDLASPVFYGLSSPVLSYEVTSADSIVFKGQFSKPVTQLTAEDFVLSGTTATVTGIELTTDDPFTTLEVTVSGGDLASLTGQITFGFAPGQDIVDLQGRPLMDQNLFPVTRTFDNTPPAVTVSDVGSLAWLGMGPGFWITGEGINDSGYFPPDLFDWSKLWITVNDGGPNITFTVADIVGPAHSTNAIGILLTAEKGAEIAARVDGSGDQFVIEEGFWVDPAGNVQTVGGGFITAADMF